MIDLRFVDFSLRIQVFVENVIVSGLSRSYWRAVETYFSMQESFHNFSQLLHNSSKARERLKMTCMIRKSIFFTIFLPVANFCNICKLLKYPLSNTRKRSYEAYLRPWDISAWGKNKHIATVRCCNEVRRYLELNYDNVVFERDTRVSWLAL